jgi:predicted RNA-binding Zn-ribbon protein involved in translation (DUF1610 family)
VTKACVKEKAELSEEEIREYVQGGCLSCPRCGGDVEREPSGHERDSSHDWHYCSKCGWRLPEMATWRYA